jgi:Predicted hydrolases or acyltransferases (alpha/beta hydrolase superfamily)
VPALDALLDYDFTDRLGRIGCPTLLIWGREDMIVPVADADEYERLIESSRKVIFDETGHVPMLERPQSFNDYLMEFVVETGPGAAGEPALRAPEVASA